MNMSRLFLMADLYRPRSCTSGSTREGYTDISACPNLATYRSAQGVLASKCGHYQAGHLPGSADHQQPLTFTHQLPLRAWKGQWAVTNRRTRRSW